MGFFFFFLECSYILIGSYSNIFNMYHFKMYVDVLCEYIFNLHSNSDHCIALTMYQAFF